jgi:hydrogenase expression/formation protein HypC
MCLATAGLILTIADAEDPLWRSAEVDFGGVHQQVSLACLPEAVVGDRVLVHVGVALALVEQPVPQEERP